MAQKQEKDKGKNTESIDDVKDLSKIIALSTKSMKKVQSVIVNHIKMISEVVTTMNDIASKDKGLQLLLEPDSIPEVDEKTGKITYKSDKSPQIIRIVDNVTKVISNIPKTIEAIAKMDLGWRSMQKIKKNMLKIPHVFREIFGTLTQELKSVLDNDTVNLFKLLQGEGDVTTKDVSYDNQGNIIFDGDKKAVMKEIAKKGKMSILDVFLKTFDLFDRIEKMSGALKLNPASYVRFKLNMKIFKKQVNRMITYLTDTLKDLGTKEKGEEWKGISNSVSSIVEVVESLDEFIDNLQEFRIKASNRSVRRIRKAINRIGFDEKNKNGSIRRRGIIGMIYDLVTDNRLLSINDDVEDRVSQLSLIAQTLGESVQKLLIFVKLGRRARPIKRGIRALSSILDLIIGTDKKEGILAKISNIDENIKKISQLKELFSELNTLMIQMNATFLATIITATLSIAGMAAMWILVGCMWVFAKGVQVLSKIIQNIAKPKQVLYIVIGIGLLVFLIASLLVLAVMLFVFATVAEKINPKIGSIILCILGIIAVSVVIGLLALVLGFLVVKLTVATYGVGPAIIVVGLATMLFLISAIVIIALELRILQEIKLDSKAIKKNVKTIIDTAFDVIKSVFESSYEMSGSKETDSWWVKVLKFVGGTAATMLTAILSVHFLALTVVSVGLILIIALELRILQEINLDKDKVVGNVTTVIDTAMAVIGSIFGTKDNAKNSPTDSDKGWFRTVLEYVGGHIATLMSAILSIQFLSTIIVSIGLICIIATQLRILQTLELDGDRIKNNVGAVFGAAQQVIDSIWGRPDTVEETPTEKGWMESALEFLTNGPHAKLLGAIMSIGYLSTIFFSVGIIKEIAEILSTIEKINLTKDTIVKKVDEIFDVAKAVTEKVSQKETINSFGIVNKLNSINSIMHQLTNMHDFDETILDKHVRGLDQIHTLITKMNSMEFSTNQVSYSQQVLDNYSKFLTKIDKTSLDKLETTTNLFAKMAEFSKSINGNFEELADSLNEKIAPLLEELRELMDGVGKKVEKTGADMSASVYAAANPSPSMGPMMAQLDREMPDAEAEKKAAIAQQRIMDQIKAQNSGLMSKFDELIELLRTGQAQIRMA